MKKIVKITFIIVVIAVIAFFGARYYAYNGGKRDVQSEKAAYVLKAKTIVAEFVANEAAANKKYLEKPVVLTGTVTSINDKEVIIDEIGVCNFITAPQSLKVQQTVSIKGRVVGYDDLMGGVNLDQCSITK